MTSIQRQCDQLWQQLIAALWNHRCARCRGTHGLAGHHIVKRRFQFTRYAATNGILLCITCHAWAEEHPKDFLKWLGRVYPQLVPTTLSPPVLQRTAEEWQSLRGFLRVAVEEQTSGRTRRRYDRT